MTKNTMSGIGLVNNNKSSSDSSAGKAISDWESVDDLFTLNHSDTDGKAVSDETPIEAMVNDDSKPWECLKMLTGKPEKYGFEAPFNLDMLVDHYNKLARKQNSMASLFNKKTGTGKFGAKYKAYERYGDRTYDALICCSVINMGKIKENYASIHIKDNSELGKRAADAWLANNRAMQQDVSIGFNEGLIYGGLITGGLTGVFGSIIGYGEFPLGYLWGAIGALYMIVESVPILKEAIPQWIDNRTDRIYDSHALTALKENNKICEGKSAADAVAKMAGIIEKQYQ